MPARKTVVVLGSTGHFGARMARRIVSEAGARVVLAGRSETDAAGLARRLAAEHPAADVCAAKLDLLAGGFAADLAALRPDIVLHAAGPFQGQDHRVAQACIRNGCHYVDLADGRDFVAGFPRLDGPARERGVLLVTGASTLPGLSSAVVDSLRERFERIHAVEISIAPAHRTPRGAGTVAAVLSYCGRPFRVLEDGTWRTAYGWQDLTLQRHPRLGARLSGACDVPDLALFPRWLHGVRTVTFHAALEAPWEQLALWLMAWLTRLGAVREWSALVPAFRAVSRSLLALGSENGGMHVRLSGTDPGGEPRSCDWYLTARRNHGPEIPVSPALVLARRLLRDGIALRGAHACLGLVSLDEVAHEVRDLDITWEVVDAE